jgi:hypothetical protein
MPCDPVARAKGGGGKSGGSATGPLGDPLFQIRNRWLMLSSPIAAKRQSEHPSR